MNPIQPVRKPLYNKRLIVLSLVFVFFLVSTFFAWKITSDVASQEAKNRFYEDSLKIQSWTQQRLDLYLLAAEGLKNTVEISGDISSDQWSNYIKKLGLIEKYPGISSLSYSPRVENQGKISYIGKYIEPLAGREKAIGFDITSEENRRRSLEKAGTQGR